MNSIEQEDEMMNNQKSLAILKQFYFGCDSMDLISKRTRSSRDEVREVLRGARECGLISYSTQDYKETFAHVRKKKLEVYLRTKGILR
ncbi:MAG: hypothetical protein ACRCW2_14355 [Cellulosilyticaceae bacterium]